MTAVALPRAAGRTSPGETARHPAAPGTAAAVGVASLIVGTTLLSRFGLNLGSYSLDFSLVFLYALVLALIVQGTGALDVVRLAALATGLGIAVVSYVVNTSLTSGSAVSASSLALLAAIYLPTLWTVPGHRRDALQRWSEDCLTTVALVCAVAGILQFLGQRFIAAPWLFDFTPYLPQSIQGLSGYNTAIPVEDRFKSNGFFFREPSSFSFIMAFALLLEFRRARRRPPAMALLLLALLLSYSGTGILALLIGLLVPFSARMIARIGVAALAGALLYLALGDLLNLDFTVARVAEFTSDRSSAYIRYVAPFITVFEQIDDPWWAILVGHGPGSMARTSHSIITFDPTWAKLIFEYGVLGMLAFTTLVLRMLASAEPSLRAVLLCSWLFMGGHLLAPENVVLLFALSGIVAGRDRTAPRMPSPTPLKTA